MCAEGEGASENIVDKQTRQGTRERVEEGDLCTYLPEVPTLPSVLVCGVGGFQEWGVMLSGSGVKGLDKDRKRRPTLASLTF